METISGPTDRQTDRLTDSIKALCPSFFAGGHKKYPNILDLKLEHNPLYLYSVLFHMEVNTCIA